MDPFDKFLWLLGLTVVLLIVITVMFPMGVFNFVAGLIIGIMLPIPLLVGLFLSVVKHPVLWALGFVVITYYFTKLWNFIVGE
jgi:hypothetical protein